MNDYKERRVQILWQLKKDTLEIEVHVTLVLKGIIPITDKFAYL